MVLDWSAPLRHATFYKSVFRPAVARANRLAGESVLSPEVTFHASRHTYASLSVAAGVSVEKLSRRLGHAKITTTLDIYTHLFPDDDASGDMAALEAMSRPNALRRMSYGYAGRPLVDVVTRKTSVSSGSPLRRCAPRL
jgi:hypothetical protein